MGELKTLIVTVIRDGDAPQVLVAGRGCDSADLADTAARVAVAIEGGVQCRYPAIKHTLNFKLGAAHG